MSAMSRHTLGYTRIVAGESGASHFKDANLEFKPLDLAPPLPPQLVSGPRPAGAVAFVSVPSGEVADWHRAPRRQFAFILTGRLQVQVSDGEVRTFTPGDVVLLEDTEGEGHLSRSVGGEALHFVGVSLEPD